MEIADVKSTDAQNAEAEGGQKMSPLMMASMGKGAEKKRDDDDDDDDDDDERPAIDFKRILAFALLGVACIVFGLLSSMIYLYSSGSVEDLPNWWRGPSFTGTVESSIFTGIISSLIVIDEKGEKRLFEIQKGTSMFFDDPVMGLRKGDTVKVIYRSAGKEKFIARSVRQLKGPSARPAVTEKGSPESVQLESLR